MDRDKKYCVEIDIEDFNLEDLNVKIVDKKFVISVRKEERIGLWIFIKELNWEFLLLDIVDFMLIKVFFLDFGKFLVEVFIMCFINVGYYFEVCEGSFYFGMGFFLFGWW